MTPQYLSMSRWMDEKHHADFSFDDEVPFDEIPPEPGRSIHANSHTLTVQVKKDPVVDLDAEDYDEYVDYDEYDQNQDVDRHRQIMNDYKNCNNFRGGGNKTRKGRDCRRPISRDNSRDRDRRSRDQRQASSDRKVVGMGVAIGKRGERQPPSHTLERTIQREDEGRMTIQTNNDFGGVHPSRLPREDSSRPLHTSSEQRRQGPERPCGQRQSTERGRQSPERPRQRLNPEPRRQSPERQRQDLERRRHSPEAERKSPEMERRSSESQRLGPAQDTTRRRADYAILNKKRNNERRENGNVEAAAPPRKRFNLDRLGPPAARDEVRVENTAPGPATAMDRLIREKLLAGIGQQPIIKDVGHQREPARHQERQRPREDRRGNQGDDGSMDRQRGRSRENQRRNDRGDRRRSRPLQISNYDDNERSRSDDIPLLSPAANVETKISGMIGNLISQVLNEPTIKNMITTLKQSEAPIAEQPRDQSREMYRSDGRQRSRPDHRDSPRSDHRSPPAPLNIPVQSSKQPVRREDVKAAIRQIFERHDIPWSDNLKSKRKTLKKKNEVKYSGPYAHEVGYTAPIQAGDDMDISDSEQPVAQPSDSFPVHSSRASSNPPAAAQTPHYVSQPTPTAALAHHIPPSSSQTPVLVHKVIDIYRYCAPCKTEFPTRELKASHLHSDLHLMVTNQWWKDRPNPNKVIDRKDQLWCIICHRRLNVGDARSAVIVISSHLKEDSHQINKGHWTAIFDKLPMYEWCFWKELDHKKLKPLDKLHSQDDKSDAQKIPAYAFTERCIPA